MTPDGWLDRNLPEPADPEEKGRPNPPYVPSTGGGWFFGWAHAAFEQALRAAAE